MSDSDRWKEATWEGNRRRQHREVLALSFRERLRLLEQMGEVAAAFTRPAVSSDRPTAVVREQRAGYGHRMDVRLDGCTPEPLMSYLKALGVLRIVSEQADPEALGYWDSDVFVLQSRLDKDALVGFLSEQYQPTPIVAPWAGGSGFFPKDNKKAVESLCSTESERCKTYASVIHHVRRIITSEKIDDKPKDEDKSRLIRRYRRELPDEVVAWMDAAMVLQHDGQGFAPLLGTGGNDGRLDFTQNFMQRVVSLDLHREDQATAESRALLAHALFALRVRLDSASVGQFFPGRGGGPNATQGMEGSSTDNPWDFILMMEGALVIAGAAVRRLGVADSPRAAFPFTVRMVAAGCDSSASKDEAESRGELWLPLWTRPASLQELRQLFGEGRAEVSGRAARDGGDFARAVAGLGVDRGITGFNRLGFLKRSGKAFLATPLGRFKVVERTDVDLLRQIDPWLDRFRRAVGDKHAPPRFASALRRIDSAIFDFCKYGGASLFQRILIALGQAEGELALTPGKVGQSKTKVSPLAGLSADWVKAADDGTAEFAVARALAFVRGQERNLGPLRANLEPVTIWYDRNERKQLAKWAENDRAVVWKAADLPTNLANVVRRRMMDAGQIGGAASPFAAESFATLGAVARFLSGDVDDKRIADLLWGLILLQPSRRATICEESEERWTLLPRAYALLKLLFLPDPIVVAGTEIVVRPEPSVVPLLLAGRVGEACRIAVRRLRSSGLIPIPYSRGAPEKRDGDWAEVVADRIDGQRLAAALLIPVGPDAVHRLQRLVLREVDELASSGRET